ncbi:hypothetical protein [Thiohalorhabdus sp.]|uniref:hypothetical protein n=1 Tax=Thiohalorhabdus sp. TaxID=3094134 RepID=UPI002FC2BEED
MAFKASTGLRNALLDTGDLTTVLADGVLRIYSGTVPTNADDAISGDSDMLVEITDAGQALGSGTGIDLDPNGASGGTITKDPNETWEGTNAASGTATYFRHVTQADDATSSTTQERLQGAVGTSGSDLNLSSVSLSSGATQTIDAYSVTLPTL